MQLMYQTYMGKSNECRLYSSLMCGTNGWHVKIKLTYFLSDTILQDENRKYLLIDKSITYCVQWTLFMINKMINLLTKL